MNSSSRRTFLRMAGAGITATISGLIASEAFATGWSDTTPDAKAAIHLDRNENAYGPSSRVWAQLQKVLNSANRYPVSQELLTRQLAQLHKVSPDCVLLGCGSTEIIRAIAARELRSGKSVITASPTFEAMAEYAEAFEGKAIAVPLDHELSHDLDAMHARIDQDTAIIYICNPNNPTASITPRHTIDAFLATVPKNVVVVVDEAYTHFAPRSPMTMSLLEQPAEKERMVVLRTFSRAYGLAGLRVGYAITSPELASRYRPFLTKAGINEIGLQAAVAAIADEEGLRQIVKRNADDRQEFFNQAMARMLKPIDSKTNFVMMDIHHPATEVIEHFGKNDILIGRAFPPMNTHIRISLGTPEEMHEFWRVWDLLPFSHGMKM